MAAARANEGGAALAPRRQHCGASRQLSTGTPARLRATVRLVSMVCLFPAASAPADLPERAVRL